MSYIIGFIGMILVNILIIRYWDLPTPLDFILGLVVLMIGIQVGSNYGRQRMKLMEQLKTQHP